MKLKTCDNDSFIGTVECAQPDQSVNTQCKLTRWFSLLGPEYEFAHKTVHVHRISTVCGISTSVINLPVFAT